MTEIPINLERAKTIGIDGEVLLSLMKNLPERVETENNTQYHEEMRSKGWFMFSEFDTAQFGIKRYRFKSGAKKLIEAGIVEDYVGSLPRRHWFRFKEE